MNNSKYPKGSEWRKWDLHIHTPASFHWNGQKFNGDPCSPQNADLVDEMIHALNSAEPEVFAIMDYWTFDGWFALKHRLAQDDAPKLTKTVFPGIELRLVAPMEGRLNAHAIFSNEVDDQVLNDFQAGLKIALIDRPLSDYSLRHLARTVGEDHLIRQGYKKEDVDRDDAIAFMAGAKIAEIKCESYKQALKNVPKNLALGFMPFSTNDGLADVKWGEHYSYVLELFEHSPIFETRNIDLWAAFAGLKTEANKNWIKNLQNALGNTPRLAISGSDAHEFIGVPGNNDRRGYGHYPSGKATWIKANPTFQGLQQAIKEPAKRSFIGVIPPKLQMIKDNKSIFIDKVKVSKIPQSTFNGRWLEDTELNLSSDLVAIIGNKGSGKSALADIIALLGNSKQSKHFSFLKENRFRGKTGEPAKHFFGQVTWGDEKVLEKNLNENPANENMEYVKYIPQGHFEELCNAHVDGHSDAFEQELRSVIFSHSDETTRLGAHDFKQLIEQQERALRGLFDSLRDELHKLNRKISSIEVQMSDETRKTIKEELHQKNRLLEEHIKVKPEEVPEPTNGTTQEEQLISDELTDIEQQIEVISTQKAGHRIELTKLAMKEKASSDIKEGIEVVKRSIAHFKAEYSNSATTLDIDIEALVSLEIKEQILSEVDDCVSTRIAAIKVDNETFDIDRKNLISRRTLLNTSLNGPQLAYQQHLELLKSWQVKRLEIVGTQDLPDTVEGLTHRLQQLNQLPLERVSLQAERMSITKQIFDLLDEQRANRENLFKPVQELIQNNELIRDEYKLQFKSEIISTAQIIYDKLFALVKQNTGKFRGEGEGLSLLKDMINTHDIGNKSSLLAFVQTLHNELDAASTLPGIESLLKKGRTTNEVYDLIFGLEYLEPRYTLMFQDAQISQLSPGQRGALLLIFYLLVDKDNNPIILDQPEENLDNETIVSLLVPVLTEAKHKRQIIMVTHNPNLAVVCDAEQIIHCEFTRSNSHNISYSSGAIECSIINNKVVNILEGTMRAFDNRKIKYM